MTLARLLDIFIAPLGGALVTAGQYLLRRGMERKKEIEELEIEDKRLNLTVRYLTAHQEWQAQGIEISLPDLLSETIKGTPTTEQWAECAIAASASHLKAVFTTCMVLEPVAEKYPEYDETLEAGRQSFFNWYKSWHEMRSPVLDYMPEELKKAMSAYYWWVSNRSEADRAAFFLAIAEVNEAIRSGKIERSEK